MAVSMKFYSNFSKRENSTKQPTGGTGYSVVFKDAFSIVGGIVKLQANFDVAKNYTAASYGSNFYNVVDVVSVNNGIVEITLSLDVLATYKSNIASYSSLLERTPSSSEINYLPDDTITNNGNLITNRLLWSGDLILNKGSSCAQIKTSNSVSAQCYYTSLEGLTEFSGKLDEIWSGNDINLITEINLVNVSLATIGSATGAVSTNKIIVGKNAYDLTKQVYAFYQPSVANVSYTPSLADVVFTYDDARKINNNYTKISFVINNTEIFLDSCFNRAKELYITCDLDINTLAVLTQIWVKQHNDRKLVYSGYTNVGIGYTLSNDNRNNSMVLSTAFRMTDSVIQKGIPSIISEIPNLIQNIPAGCSGSAPGSTLSISDLFIKVYLYEYGSTDKNPTEKGYPYYKVNSINSLGLSGYYKFVSPQLSLATLDGVKASVNSYLSNGIFYE